MLGVVAVLTLSGGTFAGLGVGTASAGRSETGTTAAGPAQPGVTTVTTPTIPAAALPGHNRPVVALGDMNTPEQFIIGQLYQLALEQEGYTVTLSRNVGPAHVAQLALQDGTLDIYPDYLGKWNSYVAHLHTRFQTLSASYKAASAYAKKHGFVLLKPTPFSDTSGLAVTSEYAQENHITSIPDLTRGTGVIIGVPLEFESATHGLSALARAYHLHPTTGRCLTGACAFIQQINDIGSQYGWLSSGGVQVAFSYTTDPELTGPEFRELRDPKHVFGFGNVVPVTTSQVLKAEGPAFKRTIERVDALLTTQAVRGLNSEYSVGRHDPTPIAEQFLEGNGILPPSQYAAVTTTTSSPLTTTTTAP
jgi:glycine betaine/choline ABC-type transport system substrate-binding protein